jgi:hypothetical protein
MVIKGSHGYKGREEEGCVWGGGKGYMKVRNDEEERGKIKGRNTRSKACVKMKFPV